MKDLGQVNDRQIIYIHTKTEEWKRNLPTSNWLALTIGHKKDQIQIKEITDLCLDNGVNYVCTIGQESKFIHDFFDDSIVTKRIKDGKSIESADDFEYEPMTTWDTDFDEGVWFAIYAAHFDHAEIKKIIVLDMTDNGELDRVEKAIKMD